MKYQLVFQLPASCLADYDELISVEEDLASALGKLADLDGHDAGVGEMNVFFITDRPAESFDTSQFVLRQRSLLDDVKVAYRGLESEEFVVLHPKDLARFEIA